MIGIGKRLLNVLTLLSTVYLVSLLYIVVTGGVADWGVFISFNGLVLLLCYGVIVMINYIFFGELTLWHRNPSEFK